MAFTALFGKELLTKSGLKPTEEVLAGKAGVLVYFSAHWCPPCRGFTPKLAEFHTKHASNKNFETVFVSSDRDESAFNEYFAEMPWVSLPYSERALKETLSKKYKVQGIPSLVVLQSDGSLATTDGRSSVMENFDTADGFPWVPPSFTEALGTQLMRKDGTIIGLDAIQGKTLGIYFSAHWCPPCRQFTPELAKFYKELKAKDPNFEIIFASSDKDEEGMKSYFQEDHGDYLALPYANRKGKDALSKRFNVEGIPSFAVVDATGKVINANARSRVTAGVESVLADGWGPTLVGDMAAGPEAAGSDINESPSLVVLCENAPAETQAKIAEAMKPLAKKYFEAGQAKDDNPDYIFIVAKGGGPLEQIKALTKKDAGDLLRDAGDEPVMILFDIPDNGGFYVRAESDITTESIAKFISDKEAGSSTRMQLAR